MWRDLFKVHSCMWPEAWNRSTEMKESVQGQVSGRKGSNPCLQTSPPNQKINWRPVGPWGFTYASSEVLSSHARQPRLHNLEERRVKIFLWGPSVQFSSVPSLSCVRLFATPWIAARQTSLSITNYRSPPKSVCIELVMPSSHLILCHPLLFLPPIPPSIKVFSNESTLLMRWPKYCSFSFNISPSNEHPGLISFRMDWLDLLAVQGTLKSLLQHHSSKASILRCSAFFTVQLSHPYMTTGDLSVHLN